MLNSFAQVSRSTIYQQVTSNATSYLSPLWNFLTFSLKVLNFTESVTTILKVWKMIIHAWLCESPVTGVNRSWCRCYQILKTTLQLLMVSKSLTTSPWQHHACGELPLLNRSLEICPFWWSRRCSQLCKCWCWPVQWFLFGDGPFPVLVFLHNLRCFCSQFSKNPFGKL